MPKLNEQQKLLFFYGAGVITATLSIWAAVGVIIAMTVIVITRKK